MATILCVDDEPSHSVMLEQTLTKIGHQPLLVSSAQMAMQTVIHSPVDLILANCEPPKLTGLELLGLLEREGYRIPVLIMAEDSSIEHAIVSIRAGAIAYQTKPIREETLEIAVTQALELARLRRENEALRGEMQRIRSTRALIGKSEPFRRLMDAIGTAAPTGATILLQGEPGTGKVLFARALHDQSTRREAPFILLHCAALPEAVLERALFGHEQGAQPEASVRTAGALERAHTGTLVLDEISRMRLDLQAKLLRVIKEQACVRVGGTQPTKVDVRLVVTTSRDLHAEVDAGRFRSDLYRQLNVVPLRTPPLRERVEDIPLLVHHFIHRVAEHGGTPEPAITLETIQLLQRYPWPGNVRELANAVERAVMLNRGTMLEPSAFDRQLREASAGYPASRPTATSSGPVPGGANREGPSTPESMPYDLDELERQAIKRALEATGGNRTRAAKLLGICERTLRNKLNTPRTVEARRA